MHSSRILAGMLLLLLGASVLHAQVRAEDPGTVDDLVTAIVGLKADIHPAGRTVASLGTHRVGTGVVIGRKGLILTIGYLILEAERVTVTTHDGRELSARVLGYDADSGFGLLLTSAPLNLARLPMGDSARLKVQDPVLVLGRGGVEGVNSAVVVSRRTFAGYWEYLLETAIFTAPPQRNFAGAALVDQNLRLVGIGSLYVENAAAGGLSVPGNMFVPINLLKPILSDLEKVGRPVTRSKPWLGVNVAEQFGRVIVTRVSPEGPANDSGLEAGDIILEIGDKKVGGLEQFYRELWRQGDAGIIVRLKLLQRNDITQISVTSSDRYLHYRTVRGQ